MDFAELWEGSNLENVYVDTSFQSAEVVKEFVKRYGEDRVLFGSDWPWGREASPIRVVEIACDGNESLAQKIFHENAEMLMKR